MRSDLNIAMPAASPRPMSEHEKKLTIVAARISGVQLNEILRRTKLSQSTVQGMVARLGNEAEKFRQNMRSDTRLLKRCSFDLLFPGKPGDVQADKAILLQETPLFPIRRRRSRSRHTSKDLTAETTGQAQSEKRSRSRAAGPALPVFPPKRQDAAALEQSVMACAKYVLRHLDG